MLYNKNNVRKTNDKKILHKVGKQWKVVSVALLMALGGGAAVATHANAQQTANNNFDTNTTAQEVAGNDSVAKYSAAPKPVSSAKAQSAKPASQVSYLSGYNGSAASFKAQASTDQSNYNLNNAIVQGYVNSLNAQYPTQTKSLGSVYNSAADQTSADQSSYASYSAIAAQSGWASKVNSLAAKANMSSSAYIESVGAETSNFNSAVSNDASANSEMSTVDSYANLISELASSNYKNPLMTEMKGNARVAAAKSNAAHNYVNNAVQISNDVDDQSSANENSLYDNQASLAANSADEAIAITNAPAEKAYVQSLANESAGSSYANSSAVSTAVSALASAYNNPKADVTINSNIVNGITLQYVDNNNVTQTTDAFTGISASEANEIATYSGNTKNYRLTVVSDASLANNVAHNQNDKGYTVESYAVNSDLVVNGNILATSDSAALVSEVSDTAAQFRYDAVNSSLTAAINNENAAVSSYNAQSASASQGVQKALNNSESASSAYQAASVLAADPTFADIFGRTTTINADTKGNADNINGAVNAINDANIGNTSYVFTNTNRDKDAYNTNKINEANALNKLGNNAAAKELVMNYYTAPNGFATLNDYLSHVFNTSYNTVVTSHKTGILNPNSYKAAERVLAGVTNYSDSDVSAYFGAAGVDNDNAADDNTMSAGVRAINSASNSVNTQLASDKASSAVYSSATDASVALASSYANSYSNDANSDIAVQSAAKTNLDNFYLGHASNASKFGSAMSAANSLSDAVPSDNASAEANGLHVYNYGPKYIFVTHAAQLHTATDYGSKDDKVLGKVAKGTPLSVLGVGFAANGATRYVVKVNGHKGYFTGNPYFSQQSYLDAMPNVDVAVNRPVKVYSNGKVVATKKPGYVFKNASVVSMDGIKHGFTRVSVGYNEFVTANVNYVSVEGLAAGNTNASEASQVQSESSNKLVNFQNDLL